MSVCARCGKSGDLQASASRGDRHARYCHADDGVPTPSCYTLSSWEGFPELTAALAG